MKRIQTIVTCLLFAFIINTTTVNALNSPTNKTDADIYNERMTLYKRMGKKTKLDWKWIAALDQYERTITRAKPKYRKSEGKTTQIYIDKYLWVGKLNPNTEETNPELIKFFDGIGRDGNNDGKVLWNDDEDLLFTLIKQVTQRGLSDKDIKIGLWDYYQNTRAVERVAQFHKLYSTFDTLDLKAHAFPLPKRSSYSYRSTWGDGRGWGGKRIHEGTDLFAPYGTEVRSTCYGVIEVLGWNKYGGWRIGIRDIDNHYHYFAHLQGFNKSLKIDQVVKPNDVIGWVGSSGYGKPGTSGKFPPHLHYGIYADRGYVEWAFDPYPSLKKWEKQGR